MTNDQAIELLKIIDNRYPCSLDSTFNEECERIALNMAIQALKNEKPNCNNLQQTKGDCISRENLKESFRKNCFHNCYYCKLSKWDTKGICYICGLIDNAPDILAADEDERDAE